MSITRTFFAALLAAFALGANAQDAAPGALPEQPVAKEQLAPEALAALNAPLEATVTAKALTAEAPPKLSFVSALNHYHDLKAINHLHGGFEPMVFRPKLRAQANDPERVILDAVHSQSVGEGFYDGARVRVYQAIDGKLVKIRDTTVKAGGHHASSWIDARCGFTLQEATACKIPLDSSFLPNREYWFCVKAIDRFGQHSEASNVVTWRTGKLTGQRHWEGPRLRKTEPDAFAKPAPPAAPRGLTVTSVGDDLQFTWEAVDSADVVGYQIFVSPVPPEQQKGYRLALADRQPCPDRIILRDDIVFVDQEKRTFTPDHISPYCVWPASRRVGSPFAGVYFQAPYKLWSDGADGYPAKWELVPHPAPVPEEFAGRGQTCLLPGLADSLRHYHGVQSPEIHYLKDTFWIAFSMHGESTALINSTSGKAEGLYEIMGKKGAHEYNITSVGSDPSLFQDDDGSVYWLWSPAWIAKMNDDLTGPAEPPRLLTCEPLEALKGDVLVGRRGPFLWKANGIYHLAVSDTLNMNANQSRKWSGHLVKSACAVVGSAQGAERDLARVERLRCESLENPLGIDAQPPRLSWKIADPRRGARQTAYRVICAAASDVLAQDQGDLWDSGKVESDQSHLVPYAGNPLSSGQIVHWKVKVWDTDGLESLWSEPARWEMGLLNPKDWKATPIAGTRPNVITDTDWMDFVVLPGTPAKMAADRKSLQERILPVSLYGKDFNLEDLPERARLYVTAHGNSYFAVYLNGQRVGDEERMPVPTFTEPLVSYYSVYDVTSLLRKGENRLRCINWSDSRHSKVPYPHRPSVTMQINGVAKGENSVLVATDLTWRHRSSPYVALGQGTIFEYYDFRIPDPTLALERTTGPDWVPVTDAGFRERTLARSIVPPERVMRRVTPVAVFSPAPGVYTFDLGEIITGNIEWNVPKELPVGSRIVFRESCVLQTRESDWSERSIYYPPDIQITDGSKRLVHYFHQNIRHFIPTVVYVAGENPAPTWRTILNNRLFRYVEVIGLKHPPKPEDLTGLMIHTDCPRIGNFESSEPDFNKFHEMCANTISMNQHGIMTDCWDREREPYNGEWPKRQWVRYVYDNDRLLRNHMIENAKTVMRLGYGAIESYAHSTPEQLNRETKEIVWPGDLVYTPQVARQCGGDLRIVRESFDAILKHLRYYRSKSDLNGSIREVELYADFGDWLGYRAHFYSTWLKDHNQSFEADIARCWFGNSPMPRRELYLLGRGVLCDMAGIAARWAAELGKNEESVELQQFHDSLKAAIHKACFNEEARSYGSFPEIMPLGKDTLDAWALFTDIPPTQLRRDIMRRMIQELRDRGHFITTGVITSLAYLRLLAEYGYADDAYAVYTREDWPSIRHYMRQLCGPGAIRENYHVKESRQAASYCHGDFTQLADWFWYGLGGLRADENHPGLKHFTLAPQIPTKMAWAKIAHESPYGKIVSSWKRDGDRVRWDVTVPANSTATALIPASNAAAIREGGKRLAVAGLNAEPGPHGTNRCELVAGSYRFEF